MSESKFVMHKDCIVTDCHFINLKPEIGSDESVAFEAHNLVVLPRDYWLAKTFVWFFHNIIVRVRRWRGYKTHTNYPMGDIRDE